MQETNTNETAVSINEDSNNIQGRQYASFYCLLFLTSVLILWHLQFHAWYPYNIQRIQRTSLAFLFSQLYKCQETNHYKVKQVKRRGVPLQLSYKLCLRLLKENQGCNHTAYCNWSVEHQHMHSPPLVVPILLMHSQLSPLLKAGRGNAGQHQC